MKKLLVLMALVPSTAFAKPTYLECTMPSGTSTKQFNITLDEEKSQALYEILPDGISVIKPAQFFADKVTFFVFSIDRKTLVMSRTASFGFEAPKSDSGQCKIAQVQTRAF